MRRAIPRPALVADAALAALMLAFGVAGTWGESIHQDPSALHLDAVAYVFVAVAAVSLAARRVWPVVTLAVVTLCASTYLVLGYPYGPILFSLLVAVYTVARYLPIRRAAIVAAVALVFVMAHIVAAPGNGPGVVGIGPGAAWLVVPFALGVTVRLQQESVARSRAEWARRHADEERLRVAREVHDVVGHGLSAIAMQAEIALHLLPTQPDQAEAALTAISRTARHALDELRVALGVVRSDDPRAPLPGLARLDALVARMSDSGVLVRVITEGDPRPLPGPVDLAAYRVVQESLTNVLRHAGPAEATVRLSYADDTLTVEITDTGAGGPASSAPGHGLHGMEQRVTALGGSFSAGPLPERGFQVRARLTA